VIFCVEDNVRHQRAGEVNSRRQISKLVANFPNFHFAEIDGTDPEVCLRAFQARRIAAAGLRLSWPLRATYSHSLSDDDKLYRSAAERERMRCAIDRKDANRLLREGFLRAESTSWSSRKHLAAEAAERALQAPLPKCRTLHSCHSEELTRRIDIRSRTCAAPARPARQGRSAKVAIRAPWLT